jgi:hypothetical protein
MVVGRVERLVLVAHQLVHRHDGALRRHHGGGRDLGHLHDRRMLAHAQGKQRRHHGLGVEALEHRHHAEVFLRGVEVLGELVELVAELARHGVPQLDVGDRRRRPRREQERRGARRREPRDSSEKG